MSKFDKTFSLVMILLVLVMSLFLTILIWSVAGAGAAFNALFVQLAIFYGGFRYAHFTGYFAEKFNGDWFKDDNG